MLIAFTFTKVNALIDKKSNLTYVQKEDYFEASEVFTSSEYKFYFAAALTGYDSETETIEDETYGKLVFSWLEWSNEGSIGY